MTLLLSGCAGYSALESQDPGPNAGRYALAQDRGPARPLNEADIQDIAVIHEPPSRGGNSDYTLFGQRYQIMDTAVGYQQEGYASWYGEKFHGHTTSNGEIYDMYKLSAAHTTLPLPTFVQVTNLENGRQVVVRVNDRGPFHEDRIIDLSYAAAVRLGFAEQGVARVRVEALTPEQPLRSAPLASAEPIQAAPNTGSSEGARSSGSYWLQFGAYREQAAAERFRSHLESELDESVVIESGSDLHRVRIGPLTASAAERLQQEWERKGNDKPLLIRP
ncbi:septal ring lytic transglycosylase RlpA family protein [Natronospirillum operosum]|uniref:septal ring lytic transglycosylase RlpA family protein n=1 Tax=Natronospirillum operosum TaxID=2759953 RepID=UPI00197B99B3|nr:septal ring lytic transglycosylase RlpA family protein [Natronospirillum operosum]